MSALIEGIRAGIILMLLIGPMFFALLQTSIERGFVKGALVAVGISISDWMYLFLCYFFISRLTFNDMLYITLGIAGTVILVAFAGYNLFFKSSVYQRLPDNAVAIGGKGNLNYLLKGFLLNTLSPTVPIFWVGVTSSVLLNDKYRETPQLLVYYFMGMLFTVFGSDILKAYLAGALRKYMSTHSLRIINILIGLIFLAGGIYIAYLTWRKISLVAHLP